MRRFKSTIPWELKLNFAGGGGESTTTQSVEFPEELKPLFRAGTSEALRIFNNPETRQLFPGSFTAGPNADITAGRTGARDAAQGILPELAGETSRTFLNQLQAGDISRDPNLPQVIQGAIDPVIARLTNEVLPTIRSGAIGAGQFGGARQGLAEGEAISGTAREALGISAKIQSDAYQRGLGIQNKALALSPIVSNQALLPSITQQQVGEQLRGEEQAAIDEQIARFRARTPQGALDQLIASLKGLNPGAATSSSSFIDPGGANQASGAVGGAALGYQASSSPVGAGLGALLGYYLS